MYAFTKVFVRIKLYIRNAIIIIIHYKDNGHMQINCSVVELDF